MVFYRFFHVFGSIFCFKFNCVFLFSYGFHLDFLTVLHFFALIVYYFHSDDFTEKIITFNFSVCYPVTSLMHARVDRSSGKPTYDRSFCIRMKSTLTKRGCHFKSSGYRVVLLLGKVRSELNYNSLIVMIDLSTFQDKVIRTFLILIIASTS